MKYSINVHSRSGGTKNNLKNSQLGKTFYLNKNNINNKNKNNININIKRKKLDDFELNE